GDDSGLARLEIGSGLRANRLQSVSDVSLRYIEVFLEEILGRGKYIHAARIEKARPGVLAPADHIGEDHRPGSPHCQPPLLESSHRQYVLGGNRERSDKGNAIYRNVVLGDPAMGDGGDGEVLPRPSL